MSEATWNVGDPVVIARPKHAMWQGAEGTVESVGETIGVRLLGRSDHIRVDVTPDALDRRDEKVIPVMHNGEQIGATYDCGEPGCCRPEGPPEAVLTDTAERVDLFLAERGVYLKHEDLAALVLHAQANDEPDHDQRVERITEAAWRIVQKTADGWRIWPEASAADVSELGEALSDLSKPRTRDDEDRPDGCRRTATTDEAAPSPVPPIGSKVLVEATVVAHNMFPRKEGPSLPVPCVKVREGISFGVDCSDLRRGDSVSFDAADLRILLNDRAHLARQVTELQTRMTEMVSNSLARRVRTFHEKFGYAVRSTPAIPSDDEVRFRASLIAEEFFEFLDACFSTSHVDGYANAVRVIRAAISGEYPYERAAVDVDLPEAYDALLDVAFVVEGTHATFGTDAEPGMAEVTRANLEKDPVYVAAKDDHHRQPDPNAKPTKPPGWRPPAIHECLIAQGWRGLGSAIEFGVSSGALGSESAPEATLVQANGIGTEAQQFGEEKGQ